MAGQSGMMSGASSGIHIKKSHEGLLHKELGIPAGQEIPLDVLEKKLKTASPEERKRIQFAINARHFSHGG